MNKKPGCEPHRPQPDRRMDAGQIRKQLQSEAVNEASSPPASRSSDDESGEPLDAATQKRARRAARKT